MLQYLFSARVFRFIVILDYFASIRRMFSCIDFMFFSQFKHVTLKLVVNVQVDEMTNLRSSGLQTTQSFKLLFMTFIKPSPSIITFPVSEARMMSGDGFWVSVSGGKVGISVVGLAVVVSDGLTV